ncbi:MAG: hypothetical protein ICV55_02530 [Coleofasciculus sp. C3-bin4]|nr:hypothetical protein [Coleofasciculus sp. C3-bin4]
MTQLPPDDKRWQEFLRQNSPTPPPAAADLEEQLMNEIATSPQPTLTRQLWTVPSALAAGLLMVWSGYRTLIPSPELSNSASLEAFLENNWNEVVGETPVSSASNSTQTDWMLEASAAHSVVLSAEY